MKVLQRKQFITLLSCILPLTLSTLPAIASSRPVGVVKSSENSQQWTEITNRLKAIGVDYCILDQAQWQQASDLNNIKVLFLPNVENINNSQVSALEQWMNQGGQVIVSGPTGMLSQPEIQSQLRSLFGAYWGFSNSSAARLRLVDNPYSDWTGRQNTLSNTFVGGVVIPTSVNSRTTATWKTKGSPPAVVVTDRSTYLGWRWGEDRVAPASFDVAWLSASLNRYGINRTNPVSVLASAGASVCNPQSTVSQPSVPILPQQQSSTPVQVPQQQPLASTPPTPANEQTFRVPTDAPSNQLELSYQQVQEMTEELGQLIARVESTLLAAEATNITLNSEAHTLIEDSIQQKGTLQASLVTVSKNNRSYQALVEAREALKTFQQLVQENKDDEARRLWLKARRNLWDHYPTDRQFAQAEIRAIWLDRGTIVQAKSEQDLAKIFDRMAHSGINVVFFETLNASYPIYPSKIAPEQNPLTQGWDPLKSAIKLAHERNMELHAWTWIFAAANQRHNLILNQPLDYLGPVLSRNPEWANINKQGGLFDYSQGYKKAFFDPANPEVQRYLLSLLEEIVTNYDVDGIQFDYIRYPFQSPNQQEIFGYSNSSRWLFKEMTGVDPVEVQPGSALWSQWTAFRMRQVDSFVATASARLKQRRPDLMVSAAVFPLERQDRLNRLQQNWEEWGQNNWVDLIFLMTYALDTGSFEDRIRPLNQPGSAGASLVIPGLRLLKVPDPVTIDQMQLVRNMPTSGFALFAAENLTPNLESIFNRTQGSLTANEKEPLPHRQPFNTVAARYQALQREWSVLLINDQLAMDEGTMKQWGRQVDSLANTFNQLAQQPTPEKLSASKTALRQFRQQFGGWMRQQQQVQPYQVQVWQNRLETLDRLLVYGERMMIAQRARERRE
ncbi:glycoside hydrolase family 10 protein [Gloeothece citriformis]|uniref:glycoside hydrolase family 10 protein n=1 Tax=Gloeothece citriformis TaxID=2546356 RepID=UPI003B833AD4